jgi:hypothetical protein
MDQRLNERQYTKNAGTHNRQRGACAPVTGRQVTSFWKKQRYIEFKLGIDTSVSSLVGRRRLSREVFYHLYLAVYPVVVGWPFDRLMVLFNKLNEKGVVVVKIVIWG